LIIRKIRRDRGESGFRVGEQGGIICGEKAFEEEGGGDLVDDGRAVETGGAAGGAGSVAGEVEEGVGVMGGEALVEEMMGEVGVSFLQGLGEGLGFGGLGAGG
jgi:hypothetical protein